MFKKYKKAHFDGGFYLKKKTQVLSISRKLLEILKKQLHPFLTKIKILKL